MKNCKSRLTVGALGLLTGIFMGNVAHAIVLSIPNYGHGGFVGDTAYMAYDMWKGGDQLLGLFRVIDQKKNDWGPIVRLRGLPGPLSKVYGGAVIVSDPGMIKEIFQGDRNGEFGLFEVEGKINDLLAFAGSHRYVLKANLLRYGTSAVTFDSLKDNTERLVAREKASGEVVDIIKFSNEFALSNVFKSILGFSKDDPNAERDMETMTRALDASAQVAQYAVTPIAGLKLKRNRAYYDGIYDSVREIIFRAIQNRRHAPEPHNLFVDGLIAENKIDVRSDDSIDQAMNNNPGIVTQFFSAFFAGRETTAATLTWMLYEMLLDQEKGEASKGYLSRLRTEFARVDWATSKIECKISTDRSHPISLMGST